MTHQHSSTRRLERQLGDWIRAGLPRGVVEAVLFVLKQAWACLFGVAMLAGLIISKAIWDDGWAIARYDALLIHAVTLQAAFFVAAIGELARRACDRAVPPDWHCDGTV